MAANSALSRSLGEFLAGKIINVLIEIETHP
jgi:hypothetical protein